MLSAVSDQIHPLCLFVPVALDDGMNIASIVW